MGGSGDDSLIMTGGNGTLSGGDGSDTFELTYSADKKLSATIEDLDPASGKIIVNFAGTSTPQLTTVTSGNDVILRDGDRLNVTLNGVRENDYFDGTISDAAWDVLELTNAEREKRNRTALTMSDGLTAGASIRVQEITAQGESGILTEHIRPGGASYVTVFDEVGKHYPSRGENIQAGAKSPEAVMDRWINSASHYANIVNPAFLKLGVGYNYDDSDPSDRRFYWEQLFGGSLSASERATVSTADLLTASVTTDTVSKSITLTEGNDTYSNSDYDVTIAALSGADQITNSGLLASISGGADNDTLINNASFATINAGAGNDSIRMLNTAQENLIQYAAGDGSDTISGLNSSDTLSITGGEFAPVTVGNNVVVNVGDDSITLVDAARSGVQIVGSQKNFFRGTERADNMTNTVEGAIIAALGGNDSIYNSGDNVSINAGADNDSINSWGNNVVFFHESGNDTIQGFGSNSTLKVAGGSYTSLVSDYYNLILIDSESGDSINILSGSYNSTINIVDAEGNPVTVGNALNIVGTELADNLSNTFNSATIRALGGDDTITNSGSNVSISGGAGNDSIDNGGVWSSIDAGAGDDSIQNSGYDVTISAGAGNDSVSNTAIQVTIDAGAGNDSIVNNASQVSINGGAGDDYLNNNGQLLTAYTYESGNDTIEGFNASDSLNVGGYSYSTVKSDDGIIVNVLNRSATVGTVTLKDYSGQYVNIVSTYAPSTVRGIAISNPTDSIFITGTAGNDSITNSGASVTIAGNRGDDRISLSGGATNNLIEYVSGDGNDTVSGFNATSTLQIGDGSGIYATVQSGSDVIVRVGNGSVLLDNTTSLGSINIDGSESTISSSIIPLTEGDDTYSNYDNDVTILALGGNDSVDSWSDNNVSIDGGADNDTINFNGINVTVTGGTGNDAISDNTDIAAHVYTGGNDTIYGFDRWSTIVIADSYSTQRNDRNVEINVQGKGTLTLENYWDDVNIVSSLDDVTHYNRLYSSGDNSTVTGTNDADHLGLWNDSVTVEAAGGGDYIYVAEANDSINVGDGDDTVRMDRAANITVEGGTGKNIFTQWGSAGTAYVYGGGNDTIEDFNQHQTLVIADSWSSVRSDGTTTINVTGKGTITLLYPSDDINIVSSVAEAKRYNFIRNNSSYSNVTGTSGDDFIKNHSSATVNAAGGDDVVFNWSTQSSINGGAGTDSIYNNYTDVTINGGADNDTINSYGSSNSIIDGGTGNDYILQGWITGSRRTGDFSTLTGGDGDDTLDNYCGKNVSISGGTGNDRIWNENATAWNSATQQYEPVSSPDNTTIDGGAGTDTISNYGSNVSIDGGAGNDDIRNYSDASNTTILGGTGDDSIDNSGSNVSISGGDGNDHIENRTVTRWNSSTQQYETVSSPDNTTIDGGAGDDTINNYGARVSIDGNAGNDNINNYASSVSIDGGAGNDYLDNTGGSSVSISGGDGTDTVWNNGSFVSIDGGAGTDTVWNYGNNVTIDGGADNDEIHNNNGSNVTMLGGTGNDEIYLSADSRNNFIRYADGDGNDTVWGITENDTLNLLADGYSTVEGRGDDLIVNVITNDVVTGSILLVDARNKPPHITLGESGTEGGGSSSGGNSGGSSSGSGGNSGGGGRGGSGGGNTSGGTSASEGRGSAASGGRSASGSSGSQTSTGISSSSGRVSRYVSTNRKDSIASAAARNLYNEMTATNQQPANQLLTPTSKLLTEYAGGNQVISNYQSGEKIIFGADYTGAFYDGAGNFFAGSSTGALAIENAMDKVIDLSDAAGNDFVKAYAATTAGVIDGRGIAGFELINGSSGADAIYAGDGGSQLWGGADVATDILVGGDGSDIFIVSKYQGSDLIVNASSRDMVYLSDANLNDIIATEENNGVVAVAFNTGNVVAVQSSEALSSTFLLNDGSQYRYNHANKSWQGA